MAKLVSFFFIFSFSILQFCNSLLTPQTPLVDGQFLVSSTTTFELGFYSRSPLSNQRFLGIWYKAISTGTVVWIANRDSPLNTTSGLLQLSIDGTLQLLNASGGSIIWSSGSQRIRNVRNPVVELLDSGNLVVREESDENYIWQSFDHPTDTALPGMKLGKNLVSGVDRILKSSKSNDDPSTGSYSFLMDTNGFPQLFLMGSNSDARFRSGPWNGERFSGAPGLKPNAIYTFDFVFNEDEIYYIFYLINSSIFTRLVLGSDGILRRYNWNSRSWVITINAPADNCDTYSLCHGYGNCDLGTNPVCACLDKFEPRDPTEWGTTDWSGGCVRRTPLNCSSDGFVTYSGLKLPDTRNAWFNKSMDIGECKEKCLKNCSCTAYSSIDITGKRNGGCLLWFEDLKDMRTLGQNGQDVYIRMAKSELASSSRQRMVILVTCLSLLGLVVILGIVALLYIRKKRWRQRAMHGRTELTQEGAMGGSGRGIIAHNVDSNKEDLDLPLVDLSTVLNATSDFSPHNKIGEGGFGPVFKGTLEGQEIAVKRLSKYSTQGLDEFKNEVKLIAKLQHRNLVKLLGCCIEEDEKMLIYEFMPNHSLDTFIFDEHQRKLLDWPSRFRIISGIARGLLYLHQDSRLRIIHRDLKAANILLDDGMNPKISDFGMARSFRGNEDQANTRRVVGTYGYMSPEYAVDGHFSVKSDVFSFGVLVLEIISGTKNRGFFHPDHHHNLLGHAWLLHQDDRSLEFMDVCLNTESSNLSQVIRSIHVGLLCVQKSPEDRPSMSNVVLMLASEGALHKPKEPGFFTERNSYFEGNTSSSKRSSSNKHTESSGNELSITIMEPR